MAVTINGGYRMPAWYDILGTNLTDRQDRVGIENSQRAIQALIDHEIARGMASEHIVLVGFSQGCAMVLHTALRLPYRIAGVIGLSGYLPLADALLQERHSANAHTPIFLGHGTHDPVVLPRWGSDTRDALSALGYPVQWHTYPMEHSLHPQEIADLSRFLQQVLPAQK
jgi:phospholipase/carboxylesterase